MKLSKSARAAGLLYLVGSLFGIVRLIYVPNTLFVYGNATATAKNIAEHELLFRFGIVSYLICAALWIFVTLALYRLFKTVNQALAVLMVILWPSALPVFYYLPTKTRSTTSPNHSCWESSQPCCGFWSWAQTRSPG